MKIAALDNAGKAVANILAQAQEQGRVVADKARGSVFEGINDYAGVFDTMAPAKRVANAQHQQMAGAQALNNAGGKGGTLSGWRGVTQQEIPPISPEKQAANQRLRDRQALILKRMSAF